MENRKVAFYTLGCKLNFSETSTISRFFEKKGYQKVHFGEKADIYVINTCSVTENADKEFKTIVKKALKLNSEAFLIAIGCYAQLKPEDISNINGVDLVLGTKEKFRIMEYLDDLSKKDFGEIHSCEIDEVNLYNSSFSVGDKTRAFLKIQDGCDYKCTYCIIPRARGISRSDSIENITESVKEITDKGIKEIVLTGVNIGDYGKSEKEYKNSFFDLLKVLDKIQNLERVRISSIEPNLLKNEIIDFVKKSAKIVPHFHIPLQSGSDIILSKMKRRYKISLYKERIEYIKNILPDACIGADVIVGFPGETDQDFLSTYNFINNLDISYLHVFSYSKRENTKAYNMEDQISKEIKNKRSKMLRILSAKKKRDFYKTQMHKIKEVLFEEENKDGLIFGFTDNYIRVAYPYEKKLINSKKIVLLKNLKEDYFIGE